MNKFGKATLLAGASAVAMGLATSTASAFDKVDWDWHARIFEKVFIKVVIDPKFDPSGLVQVEKLQIFVGDVKANAWVDKVIHKPAAPGYDVVKLEHHSNFAGTFEGQFKGEVHGKVLDGYKCDWWGKKCRPDFDPFWGKTDGVLYGTFSGEKWGFREVLIPQPFTRDQLPLVEIAATAIGNVETIDSDVAVLVHEGQFVLGDGNNGYLPYWLNGKNEHTQLADALLYLAIKGDLVKANIEANAGSYFITQAQADIDATAIANLHTINVDAADPINDGIVIADITQFAYADVSANAYLGTHLVYNYNDLGKLKDALTSVTATAIGNISTITVCTVECDD